LKSGAFPDAVSTLKWFCQFSHYLVADGKATESPSWIMKKDNDKPEDLPEQNAVFLPECKQRQDIHNSAFKVSGRKLEE